MRFLRHLSRRHSGHTPRLELSESTTRERGEAAAAELPAQSHRMAAAVVGTIFFVNCTYSSDVSQEQSSICKMASASVTEWDDRKDRFQPLIGCINAFPTFSHRSIRLWGPDGQIRMERANALVLGASATACETLKNLVLPGLVRHFLSATHRHRFSHIGTRIIDLSTPSYT
jgi:hypothetical protein